MTEYRDIQTMAREKGYLQVWTILESWEKAEAGSAPCGNCGIMFGMLPEDLFDRAIIFRYTICRSCIMERRG